MKKIIKISVLLFFTVLCNSCKKEVQQSKSAYIGEWHAEYKTEVLTINGDGGSNWEYDSGTGDHDFVNGRIRFYKDFFEIKGLGKKRKFTIEVEPSLINTGVTNNGLYSYYAKFNGKTFYRK